MLPPRIIAAAGLAALCACQEPPPKSVDRIDPPKREQGREDVEAFRRKAHADALAQALPLALEVLKAGDPLATYQAGLGPAAIPVLSIGARLELSDRVDAAQLRLTDIDENYLEPASVVILRAVRFAINRLNDELERRPQLRQDPTAPLRAVAAVLDELAYRLVQDECDAGCEGLPAQLAAALPETRSQLAAASMAATRRAGVLADQLAARSRELGERPLLEQRADARAGLEQLAKALDDHRTWLAELGEALPNATATREWSSKPALVRPGGVTKLERLPDVLGAQALSRRFTVEEHLDLDPERDVARVAMHVRRWEALRRELVPDPVAELPASAIDVPRCETALARIAAGLADVEGIEPPRLDCGRFVDLFGDRELSEAALVLELLDYGVIEPQRRALRRAELPEIAIIAGQWSPAVHTHLRRVMLLARLPEPGARSLAIDEGIAALCLAEAALWVHTELGLATAVHDAIGPKCAALDPGLRTTRSGERASRGPEMAGGGLLELVLDDPRGALTGYGLSLIGDEPAKMVGFDRFFWAPLGLMQTLATPQGMHPDQFTLPSEATGGHAPAELDVKIEDLSRGAPR